LELVSYDWTESKAADVSKGVDIVFLSRHIDDHLARDCKRAIDGIAKQHFNRNVKIVIKCLPGALGSSKLQKVCFILFLSLLLNKQTKQTNLHI